MELKYYNTKEKGAAMKIERNIAWGKHKINMDYLKHIDDFSNIIYQISGKTKDLLNDVYSGEEIQLPISVDKVAQHLGVEIYTKNLNLANPRKENQCIGELYGNEISIEETVSWSLRRYTIAHEIGHYMIEDTKETAQYALPLLACDSSELLADLYALFLLIPLENFLKEFKEYIDNIQKYPIDITEWWKTLSEKTEVPYHSIAGGYMYFRLAALQYYKDRIKGKPLREQIENWGDVFY